MRKPFTEEDMRSVAAALIAEAAGQTWGQGMAAVRLSDMYPTELIAGLPCWKWRRLAQIALDHVNHLPSVCEDRIAFDEDRYFLSCSV